MPDFFGVGAMGPPFVSRVHKVVCERVRAVRPISWHLVCSLSHDWHEEAAAQENRRRESAK